MIKILTIVGARPQLIKAAAISRAIRTVYPDKIQEVILHTGQHYDKNMSEVFFTELSIPRPEVNLNVGSGSHGSQTANMLEGIERAILDHQPDVLVIYVLSYERITPVWMTRIKLPKDVREKVRIRKGLYNY